MTIICEHCGYEWQMINEEDAKKTLKAAKINKAGPFCGLCRTLEEAARFAEARDLLHTADIVRNIQRHMSKMKRAPSEGCP